MTDTTRRAGRSTVWWDVRLFWLWVGANAAAYLVIVFGGAWLVALTSGVGGGVVSTGRTLTVVLVAVGASLFYGVVLGRLQWLVLRQRMPMLSFKRWFVATVIPAFLAFAIVIGPDALNKVVSGSDPFDVFKDAFVQAFVLGPLIGASQAKALQGHTTRWKWWFVGNVTSWLFGAATIELAEWLLGRVASYPGDSVSVAVSPAFPLLAIAVHGLWMLWVTSPEATRDLVASESEPEPEPGDLSPGA